LARENFKREQEVLRTLFLDGGAMTRRQFAAQLGLSMESLDKVLSEIKRALDAVGCDDQLRCEKGSYIFARDRRSSSEMVQKVLSVIYRMKAVRQTEIERIILILRQLQQGCQTLPRLIDSFMDELKVEVDRKTAQTYIDYLIEVGIVSCNNKKRPFRYSLKPSLFELLANAELEELYSFVEFAANTDVFSAAGCLMLDSLAMYMRQKRGIEAGIQVTYKYNYFGRILDEYICHELLDSISKRKKIRIIYGGKESSRYRSFSGESQGSHRGVIIPVRIVYDHQYGRWYLLAFKDRPRKETYDVYRIERIKQIEPLEQTVDEAVFKRMIDSVRTGIDRSWVVSTVTQAEEVEVVVRFWFATGTGGTSANYIRERVEREGRWGTIEPEGENTFIYRIAITDMSEIKSWLLSFGSAAEVMEPEILRHIIINEWEQVERHYANL